MTSKELASESGPMRVWEIIRLSAWVFVFTLRSTADLLDHTDSRRA